MNQIANTVRGIAEKVNYDNCPVTYHTDLTRDSLFDNNIWNEDVPQGATLLDFSVKDAFEALQRLDEANNMAIMSTITDELDIAFENITDYHVILFIILHEFGHWNHFINSGLSKSEFRDIYGAEVGGLVNEFKVICKQYPDQYSSLRWLYAMRYRFVTMEKIADKYAIEKMKSILEFV